MIRCPTCGAQNDPANRFCDQCGTRMEPAETAAAPLNTAQSPTAAMTCPTCGAAVVPGEAFCETCGAELSAPTVAPSAPPAPVASDAPTVAAPAPGDETPGAGQVCPACGQVNMADARYCDNCGAELGPAAGPDDATMVAPPVKEPTTPLGAETPAAQPDDATMVMPPAEDTVVPPEEPTTPAMPADPVPAGTANETVSPAPVPPDDETLEQPAPGIAETEAEPEQQAAETTLPPNEPAVAAEPTVSREPAVEPAVPAEPAAPSEPAVAAEPATPPGEPAPATTEEPVAPDSSPAPAPADTAAERQRLEELVAAHRETISQYEQMLSRYPAGAAPAFLTAGLDEARQALKQSEAELAALPEVPAGPDPAEVQRLEALIAAHRETIDQYEQMLSRYPAGAAPAFLTAGLDEARRALKQSEAELQALTGSVPAADAATSETIAATAGTTPSAEAAAPPPAPAGARIVLVDGGHELALPSGKTVIIVGREDPVSDIFPEIDMTPFGGESGGVSRQHARLDLAGGQWTVTDLNSTNYTRVDGNRLEPNTATPIHDGSRLQFGRIAAIFHT